MSAKRRSGVVWTTVAVTPLPPGYRNAFHDGNTVIEMSCPAILLQENHRDWVSTESDFYYTHHEAPYETRAIAATMDGSGVLEPIDDCYNFICTLAPGETTDALYPLDRCGCTSCVDARRREQQKKKAKS